MSRSIFVVGLFLVATGLMFVACFGGEEAPPAPVQMQPIAPPVQQVPVPAPVAAPTPPPPTPLIPIEAETGTVPTSGGGGGGGVDAPILGLPTDGSELIGNYLCSFDAKGLPTGPFNLPPFGCRIYKAGDGSLKIGQGRGAASSKLKGSVKNTTDRGFFIVGKYEFPGNKIEIKARMLKKQSAKPRYAGRGRGTLNTGGIKIKYTLEMNKK